MRVVIGVDESGTGAMAGPFTVCAYAAPERYLCEVTLAGATDSKSLSDPARREIAAWLLVVAGARVGLSCVAAAKSMPQRPAWREAIVQAVLPQLTAFRAHEVVLRIDGKPDSVLTGYFQRQWGITPEYIVGGDAKEAVIGAASIIAKTARNDAMLELAKQYPHYGFDQHYGYVTEAHLEAVALYGICPEHRRVRTLAAYFGNDPLPEEDICD